MSSDQEDFDVGNTEIAEEVYKGIDDDGFDNSAVEALLQLVRTEGQIDMLGDVLIHLARRQHPDWAAEICRMVIAGAGTKPPAPTPDYSIVASVMSYMVDMGHIEWAHKVCTFILMLKDNGQGGSFFDCYDISYVLGTMAGARRAQQAGAILFAIYCDDSAQGQVYQELVPYVLGTLIDYNQPAWALELAKQLMYSEGKEPSSTSNGAGAGIDYSVLGWAMAQMVFNGRSDWAASLCDGIKAQKLAWYNQQQMLDAISAWGGPSCSQTVANFMTGAVTSAPMGPTPGGPPAGKAPSPRGHTSPPAGKGPGQGSSLAASAAPFNPSAHSFKPSHPA